MTDTSPSKNEVAERARAYYQERGYWGSHADALYTEVERLQRENRILALKAGCSLANNLCPDHRDKQTFKSCLACEIERLTARLALETGALEQACAAPVETPITVEHARNRTAHETTAIHPDTVRLNWIETECAELRCHEERGFDDADVYYEAWKFYMSPPRERPVGRGTGPREALDAAMKNDDDECCYCGQERNCGVCSPTKSATTLPTLSAMSAYIGGKTERVQLIGLLYDWFRHHKSARGNDGRLLHPQLDVETNQALARLDPDFIAELVAGTPDELADKTPATQECSECEGSGESSVFYDDGTASSADEPPCSACGGSGQVPEKSHEPPVSRERQLCTALGQWLHDFGSTNELSQRTRILLDIPHPVTAEKSPETTQARSLDEQMVDEIIVLLNRFAGINSCDCTDGNCNTCRCEHVIELLRRPTEKTPEIQNAARYQWLRSHIASTIIQRIDKNKADLRPEALDTLIDCRMDGIAEKMTSRRCPKCLWRDASECTCPPDEQWAAEKTFAPQSTREFLIEQRSCMHATEDGKRCVLFAGHPGEHVTERSVAPQFPPAGLV